MVQPPDCPRRDAALPQGGDPSLHSRAFALKRFGGATATRVIDGGHRAVREHAHDWPILSLFIAGDYLNTTDEGRMRIHSPAAIFYRRGDAHANVVGGVGHEQIEIEFDPGWIGSGLLPCGPRRWIGGVTGGAARQLARLWTDPSASERLLRQATSDFLAAAAGTGRREDEPRWMASARLALGAEEPATTAELAERYGVSAHWVAEAYRRFVGEGISGTVRRRRVERAAALLRESEARAADIAADAGFCDQSHMIRAFHAVLGRSPGAVRAEWRRLGATS